MRNFSRYLKLKNFPKRIKSLWWITVANLLLIKGDVFTIKQLRRNYVAIQYSSSCNVSNIINFGDAFYMVIKLLLMKLEIQYVLFLHDFIFIPFICFISFGQITKRSFNLKHQSRAKIECKQLLIGI